MKKGRKNIWYALYVYIICLGYTLGMEEEFIVPIIFRKKFMEGREKPKKGEKL